MGQAVKRVCSDSGRAATQRSQKQPAYETGMSTPKPHLQMSNPFVQYKELVH